MLRSHHLLLTSILLLSYFHPCPRSDSQHSSRALPRFGSNGVPGIGVAIPGVYNTTFRWLLPAPAAPLPFGCGAARCGGVYGGKGGFLSRVSFADPLNIIFTKKNNNLLLFNDVGHLTAPTATASMMAIVVPCYGVRVQVYKPRGRPASPADTQSAS